MGRGALRVGGSLAGLALLSALGAALLAGPSPGPAPADAVASWGRRGGFHGAPFASAPAAADTCRGCHGAAPHGRSRARAFLNLHAARLDCGVCHLPAEGAAYRRLEGLVTAGRAGSSGWQPRMQPLPGEEVRRRGPRCGECHHAGSAVLGSGVYDAWQRRVLEEPALLYRLGGAAL